MPRCRCKIHQSTTSIEDQVAIIVIQKNDLSHFLLVFFSRFEEQKRMCPRKTFFQILLCLEVTCGRWFVEEVEKTWGNNSKLILSDTPRTNQFCIAVNVNVPAVMFRFFGVVLCKGTPTRYHLSLYCQVMLNHGIWPQTKCKNGANDLPKKGPSSEPRFW